MYFTCPVIKHVLEPPLAGLASSRRGGGGYSRQPKYIIKKIFPYIPILSLQPILSPHLIHISISPLRISILYPSFIKLETIMFLQSVNNALKQFFGHFYHYIPLKSLLAHRYYCLINWPSIDFLLLLEIQGHNVRMGLKWYYLINLLSVKRWSASYSLLCNSPFIILK